MWSSTSNSYFLGKISRIHEAYSYYASRQCGVQSLVTDQARIGKYVSMTNMELPSLKDIGCFFSLSGFRALRNLFQAHLLVMSCNNLAFVGVIIRHFGAIVISLWFELVRRFELLLFVKQFLSCCKESYVVHPWEHMVRNPFMDGLQKHLSVLDFSERLYNAGYKPTFCVITYKIDETNIYPTITNLTGDVLISRSAGSLGIRKSWERQYPGTFARLLDICLNFIKKHKLADHAIVQVPSYRVAYYKLVYWKTQSVGIPVWAIQFMPKQIHGHPLRFRRYKRL